MDEKELQLLYNEYAKGQGFKDYGEFKTLLSNKASRQVFFEDANPSLGFKDMGEFDHLLGFDSKEVPQPVQNNVQPTEQQPTSQVTPFAQTFQFQKPINPLADISKPQKPVSDATHLPQNRTLENDAAIQQFDAGVKDAVTNTATARLKAKGAQVNPQALSSEIESTRQDLKSGKLSVNRTDDGAVTIGRSAGFWDGVVQNVANTVHNLKYAPALIAAHINGDDKGLADIAEEMAKEKEHINNHPYQSLGNLLSANPSASAALMTKANTVKDEGEKQLSYNSSMGSLGQTVGGAVTNLAPLLIPGAGEAEAGTSALLQQLAANTPRMIAGGVQTGLNTIPERFLANYQENKANGLTADAAAKKAVGDAEIQSIIPAVAGGAFFSGAFGGGASGKGLGEALGHALKNGAKFSGIMGAQAGLEDAVKQMQGYKANYGEDIGEAMKSGFAQTMAMELLPHALSLPSYVRSQLYNHAAKAWSSLFWKQHYKVAPMEKRY
jgi:hypothetical protein